MGRPLKRGLDYFPLDVDFLSDEKVQVLAASLSDKHNSTLVAAGFLTVLWGQIYRRGSDPFVLDKNTTLYLSRLMRISPEKLHEFVTICAELGIFMAQPWHDHGTIVSRRVESTLSSFMEERERKRQYWDAKRGGDRGGDIRKSSIYKSSNSKSNGNKSSNGASSAPSTADKQAQNNYSQACMEARRVLKERGIETPNQDQIRAEAEVILSHMEEVVEG